MRHVVQSPQLLWRKQPHAPARLSSSRRCKVLLRRPVRAGNRCSTLHDLIRMRSCRARWGCSKLHSLIRMRACRAKWRCSKLHGLIRMRSCRAKCRCSTRHGRTWLGPRRRKRSRSTFHDLVRVCSAQKPIRPRQTCSSVALRLALLHQRLSRRVRLGDGVLNPRLPSKSGPWSTRGHTSVSQPAPHVGCPLKNRVAGSRSLHRGCPASMLHDSTALLPGSRRGRGR